jgi:ABC-2 type transport system permease protein
MRNIWLVIKHDIIVTLQQPSFWILTLLLPILLMLMNTYFIVGDNNFATSDSGPEAEGTEAETADTPQTQLVGLVDEAGFITEIPATIPDDLFVRYVDEATAVAALETDKITQIVFVHADYITTGEVTIYDKNFQISSSGAGMGVAFDGDNEWMLQYLLDYNLAGDEQFLQQLRDPVPWATNVVHVINPPEEIDQDANSYALASVVASVMPYVYYFLMVMGGNYMMRSVVAEKENRTVELLLLSLEPRQLMIGKIAAMSAVVLIQVVAWVGSGVLILNRSAAVMNAANFAFPPGFLIWAILFLVLGYLFYAAIMAMAGAVAPNAREGAQMIWLLIIPLMPTLMFGSEFVNNPDGTLSLFLSIFPMSAPSAMVTRLAVADVPLWQVGLSLGLLAVMTYGCVVLAGHFFRTGNLLSQAPFNLKRFATGWRES